jgi:hypothetical protein
MIARWLGLEDPWNVLAYSWCIPVSPFIVQLGNTILGRISTHGINFLKKDKHVLCVTMERIKQVGWAGMVKVLV